MRKNYAHTAFRCAMSAMTILDGVVADVGVRTNRGNQSHDERGKVFPKQISRAARMMDSLRVSLFVLRFSLARCLCESPPC